MLFENNFNLSHHELKTLFARSGSVKLSRLHLELAVDFFIALFVVSEVAQVGTRWR